MAKEKVWSLAAQMPEDDCLIATMPDWDGRVWFFTQQGVVGTLDRATGAVRTAHLPAGEAVTNSVSTDETGGMYVVSTHALYRLDAAPTAIPQVTWREVYDRGSRTKPGNLSQGSGTTPTLLGDRWVAINDNADPKTQVLVYDRRDGVAGPPALRCARAARQRRHHRQQPGGSGQLVHHREQLRLPEPAHHSSAGPPPRPGPGDGRGRRLPRRLGAATDRADLGRQGVARQRPAVRLHEAGPQGTWSTRGTSPPSTSAPARPSGAGSPGIGIPYNNHYAAIYLGPDGAAYVATIAGLVRVTDHP